MVNFVASRNFQVIDSGGVAAFSTRNVLRVDISPWLRFGAAELGSRASERGYGRAPGGLA